ncbi:hypothetical protein ACFLKB_12430 [Clostridium sp. FAM 1755]|uniref:Uncharacterized protein n=1 Tax=Clostridium sporogenes TaxID=1509 RepID=A0AAE4JSU8_CLOSG|nr:MULTISPECIES: hypothetical protein [Clostridium]KOR26618.1 hypothetical protein ND00_04970 [Clostridium sp. L74]MDS1002573.1 hypothetical protein [Clostridium sporogenes]
MDLFEVMFIKDYKTIIKKFKYEISKGKVEILSSMNRVIYENMR